MTKLFGKELKAADVKNATSAIPCECFAENGSVFYVYKEQDALAKSNASLVYYIEDESHSVVAKANKIQMVRDWFVGFDKEHTANDQAVDYSKGRMFAYCRVSTTEQTTENQVIAIKNHGYAVTENRVISETVSGSVQAMQREQFKQLVDHKLEKGDTLVVLKLDRLGRDNIDVQQTITLLSDKGIRIICLDLPHADLSSSEGKLMLQLFSAFAEFERNRIKERTQEGLARAKAEGKKLGRPKATDTYQAVQGCKLDQLSQSQTALKLGLGIATVKRHWKSETL